MSIEIYTQDASVYALVRKAYPDYTGRKVSILPVEPGYMINCASYWDHGYRDYFTFLPLVPDASVSIQAPPQSAYDRQVAGLDRVALPKSVVCVVRSFMGVRESVQVIVRTDDLAPGMLPAAIQLSERERACLKATYTLKNTYGGETDLRRKSTGMDRDTWAVTQLALQARGLLNRAGAITDAGRNALASAPSPSAAPCAAPCDETAHYRSEG